MKEISGGYCGGVPPLPIPNREVKPTCADGTAQQCGRVGSRLLLRSEALETEMSSGLFCIYPVFLLCYLRNPFCVYSVFFPYCLRNRLVLLLSFSRIAFGIVWCCSCLFSVLPLEFSCVYSAFLWNCFWSPFVFVLFLLCAYFVSVYFLCCFQIVLIFPPFNFYIIRRFVFYCLY